jgi:hypothetical protein
MLFWSICPLTGRLRQKFVLMLTATAANVLKKRRIALWAIKSDVIGGQGA